MWFDQPRNIEFLLDLLETKLPLSHPKQSLTQELIPILNAETELLPQSFQGEVCKVLQGTPWKSVTWNPQKKEVWKI